ncbi:MAG: S-methyl-5'-thioadenosine phosphorylase [Acidimicrobiales bacterium]
MEAEIGVIGGSGLYSLLAEVDQVEPMTPYGPPSGPIAIGRISTASGDRSVAFVARHGVNHQWPPHRINYRANLWALHTLGVNRVLGPSACGSLRPDIRPGDLVVCDQFVDYTQGRATTFFDGPVVNHVSITDPYCPELSRHIVAAAGAHHMPVHDRGTVVVIPGPRFATRAESTTYRALGYDIVNMTQCPEVALARELGMCYATIALVTDYDSGLADRPDIAAVNQAEVFEVFAANVGRLRTLLQNVIRDLRPTRGCACADATNGLSPSPPA